MRRTVHIILTPLLLLSLLSLKSTSAQGDLLCNQFRTQTQGGWGSSASGNNPGTYRDLHFTAAFPQGITLGCNYTLKFTTAGAIQSFLPSGGTSSMLTENLVNPSNYGNVLAGQLLALTLSVGFDANDPEFSPSQTLLGDQIVAQGSFAGLTVSQVLAAANAVLGGCETTFTPSQITSVLSSINENYVDGAVNGGFLLCPESEPNCYVQVDAVSTNCLANGQYALTITVSGANGAYKVIAPGAGSGNQTTFCFGNPADAGSLNQAVVVLTFSQGSSYGFEIISVPESSCLSSNPENSCAVSEIAGVSPDCCELAIECPSQGQTVFTCTGDIPPANPDAIDYSDNCGPVTVTVTESQYGSGCSASPILFTRTYTVSDGTNAQTCVQVYTVIDNVAPVIECPEPQYAECSAVVAPSIYPVVTDNCAGNLYISFSNGVITECGSFVRTWLAMDACGNTATCQQMVYLTDNTPPAISAPPHITLGCNSDLGPVVTGFPSASDFCSEVSISAEDGPMQGNSCARSFVRTFTATDACGNASIANQTITIADYTGPVIYGVPPSQNLQCGSIPEDVEIYAFDACQQVEIGVTMEEVISANGCNTTIWRTYTATDRCGNTTVNQQTIVIEDTQGPNVDCPADVMLNCGDTDTDPASTGIATAQDNCSGDFVSITYQDSDLAINTCPPTLTRTWIAVDTCGNASSCVQKIMFIDNTPPQISCPAQVTVNCAISGYSPEEIGYPVATDDCSEVSLVYNDLPLEGACPVTIVRMWMAVDACGNSTSCAQTITLIDETPPMLNCPADININCGYGTSPPPTLTGMATATDICTAVTLTYSDGPLTGECPKFFVRTWTATDYCGNTISCGQNIYLEDNMLPLINCPADVVVTCGESTDPGTTGMATAIDFCSSVSVAYVDNEIPGACPPEISRVWTATDACGNQRQCIQTIFIESETDPVITCPDDIILPCGSDVDPVTAGTASAQSDCASLTLTYVDTLISQGGGGTGNGGNEGDCGQLRTQTQGGWGASANGNNPGAYRDAHFASAFPEGLTVGCNYTLTLTSSAAVQAFLPSGGPVKVLTENLTDPTNFSSVLAGQLVAATLSIGFDYHDIAFGESDVNLGDMIIGSGEFDGYTVNAVLAAANQYFGGCETSLSGTSLVQVLTAINQNYVDGTVNGSFLECPETDDNGGEEETGCNQIIRTWTASDGCGKQVQCTQTISFSPALPPREPLNYDAGIVVWPSPTRSEITLQTPEGQFLSGTVEVLNLSGQVLIRESAVPRTEIYNLNLVVLDPGIYIIRVVNPEGIRSAKVIKQ